MRRLDLPVWIAAVVMLGAGWGLIKSADARMIGFADPQGSLRLQYPAGWLRVPGSTALLEIQDPLSGAPVATTLLAERAPRPADQTLDQIAREGTFDRSQRMVMYRVLRQRAIRVGGHDAVAVDYAFVADPHQSVPEAERLPVVMRGTQVVVATDKTVYRIDLRASAAASDRARVQFERILREVQL
jgi:hypothetical protein